MSAILRALLELLKYGPTIIEIVRLIIDMIKTRGREQTVTTVRAHRDYWKAKDKIGQA